MSRRLIAVLVAMVVLGTLAIAQAIAQEKARPMSPTGTASTQVLGKWGGVNPHSPHGGKLYEGGQWIDITYGRPILRGRDPWGSGADYGKDLLLGAPIWRGGANVSTRLRTDVPMVINGTTVPPGEYSLFIDLKPGKWTFVVSTWPAAQKYDPSVKDSLWGAFFYTPDKDVVRAPMKMTTLPWSQDELTWEFINMTDAGGSMAISWAKQMASVPFTFGH